MFNLFSFFFIIVIFHQEAVTEHQEASTKMKYERYENMQY